MGAEEAHKRTEEAMTQQLGREFRLSGEPGPFLAVCVTRRNRNHVHEEPPCSAECWEEERLGAIVWGGCCLC